MASERDNWFVSSYTGSNGGNCVEVSPGQPVLVRDSKDRGGLVLAVSPEAWAAFTRSLKGLSPATPVSQKPVHRAPGNERWTGFVMYLPQPMPAAASCLGRACRDTTSAVPRR